MCFSFIFHIWYSHMVPQNMPNTSKAILKAFCQNPLLNFSFQNISLYYNKDYKSVLAAIVHCGSIVCLSTPARSHIFNISHPEPHIMSWSTSSWSSEDHKDRGRDHTELQVRVSPGPTGQGGGHNWPTGRGTFSWHPGVGTRASTNQGGQRVTRGRGRGRGGGGPAVPGRPKSRAGRWE